MKFHTASPDILGVGVLIKLLEILCPFSLCVNFLEIEKISLFSLLCQFWCWSCQELWLDCQKVRKNYIFTMLVVLELYFNACLFLFIIREIVFLSQSC